MKSRYGLAVPFHRCTCLVTSLAFTDPSSLAVGACGVCRGVAPTGDLPVYLAGEVWGIRIPADDLDDLVVHNGITDLDRPLRFWVHYEARPPTPIVEPIEVAGRRLIDPPGPWVQEIVSARYYRLFEGIPDDIEAADSAVRAVAPVTTYGPVTWTQIGQGACLGRMAELNTPKWK